MAWQFHGFNQSEFIQHYWQKKPCLIRGAFPDFQSPIEPEDLAGLACEEEVHSRLIIEKDAEAPWALSYGPFQEAVFLELPETHYSLLVSECEKWIPELDELLKQFRFIPQWRIDDVMVSYAPPGGSVGAHTDEYDVFLLQAQGHRKWQYSDNRVDNPALIPGLDLAIMQNFNPDQEAILSPGDMLYLPPGIAHHGVAMDPCLTFSIGFRASTATEILESFILEAGQKDAGKCRYSDPDLETDRHSSEITRKEIKRYRAMVIAMLDQPDHLWIDTIGKLLSDSAVGSNDSEAPTTDSDSWLRGDWIINPESRMLYHRGETGITFYCDGRGYNLPGSDPVISLIQELCETRSLSEESLETCCLQKPLRDMLLDLEKSGAVVLYEE